jgi:class 3 adenylate cyclase
MAQHLGTGVSLMDGAKTRYVKTRDGTHLAYQVVGDGPVDIAVVWNILGNVEAMWQVPAIADFAGSLASFSRLIVHDYRGTGLSDRGSEHLTIESRLDDLIEVLTAAGSTKCALLGMINGGAIAALFAAEHPEFVSAFVWYGATPRTAWADDYPWGVTKEEYLRELRAAEEDWGSEEVVRAYFEADNPSLTTDAELAAQLGRLLRQGLSPAIALDLERQWFDIDVRHVLPSIKVPTLLIDREWETVGEGAYTASLIPDCKRVVLPGTDTLPFLGDSASVADAIREFLGVARSASNLDRVLTTVLFTDIVGSTDKACAIGDSSWRELLGRHDQVVRAMLARFRGTEVKTTGDGFLARFDGPARATECARAICEAVKPLNIEVRAGCHTGEVELMGMDVGGISVHIGARIAALAEPSEVLVSSTVKDLVAGSGLAFVDRGEHELRGVPGTWRLYALTNSR